MPAERTEFVEEAERWLQSLRQALDEGRGDVIRELADALEPLQQRGSRLLSELRRTPRPRAERARLLQALRGLRRQALVCAALLESDLLTLKWTLDAARPPGEYQADGTVSGAASFSKQWSI